MSMQRFMNLELVFMRIIAVVIASSYILHVVNKIRTLLLVAKLKWRSKVAQHKQFVEKIQNIKSDNNNAIIPFGLSLK